MWINSPLQVELYSFRKKGDSRGTDAVYSAVYLGCTEHSDGEEDYAAGKIKNK